MTETRAQIIIQNEAKIKMVSDRNVEQLIYNKFSYEVPGKMWIPSVKNGMWDGVIRLYKNNSLSSGLQNKLEKTLNQYNITYNVIDKRNSESIQINPEDISKITFEDGKGGTLQPYDFQMRAINLAANHKKLLILSPTGSGKSLIICALFRLFEMLTEQKVLVIFPRIGLVNQTFNNIVEYGQSTDNIQKISSQEDVDKFNIKKQIIFTTWQSIQKMPAKWFEQFGMVIGDEAHRFEAKSQTKIMDSCVNAQYRVGLTGSTKGDKINEITLESLFGPIHRVATTSELQERGILSNSKIVQLYRKIYDDRVTRKRMSYEDQINIVTTNEDRNKFLTKFANKLDGNTLILFRYNEKHGIPLYEMIKELDCSTYFISGGIHPDEREKIRKLIEKDKKSVTVASIGTFSEGIDIKNIHHIILAHPVKSKVQVIQSIGRGLRIADNGKPVTIWDIVDVIEGLTSSTMLKHARIRESMYKEEQHNFKKYEV